MLEVLTGTGLAASSGLNAYIPLLTMGILSRYTDLIALPNGFQWLENGWVLIVLGVLLSVEMVADKVPVVDSVNDVLQTVVRPSAGGITFGAAASAQTVTVEDPGGFFSDATWVPVVIGIVISLVVHAAKATARPVLNAATAGFGAPVVSTVEDGVSVALAFLAILLPVLVLFLLVAMMAVFWWAIHRRRTRRRARAASVV